MRLVYNLRDRKRKIRVKAEALRILNLHRIKQRSARIVTNFIRKAGKLQTVYVDSKPVFSSKRVNALTNKLHYATEELNLGLARLYINTDIIKKESPSKKGPPSSPKGKTSHLKSPLSLTLHASPDHDDFRGGRRYRSLIGEENDGVISPTSPSFIKHNRRGAISPNLIVVEGSPETFPAPVLPAVQIITSNVPSKRIAHFSPPKDSLYRSRLMPPSPHLFSKLPNGAFLIPAAMVNHTAASVGGKDLKKSVYLSPVKPVLKISGTQGKIADKGGDHCGSPPKDPQGINLSLRDCLKDAFRN